jgi:hypothetical protein
MIVDVTPELKQLRIKINVVKRIWKEFYGYNQEEAKQKLRIQALIDSNGEEERIKKEVPS